MIEAEKGWLDGSIAFAEAHAFSTRLHKWLILVVAPLCDRYSALIEAAEDPKGEAGGFWVRFTHVDEIVIPEKVHS
ncbi:MAG: hypothetical protein WBX25_11480 [Rhodomicrobium sp.]